MLNCNSKVVYDDDKQKIKIKGEKIKGILDGHFISKMKSFYFT